MDESGRTRFAFGAVGPRAFVVEADGGALADPDRAPAEREDALREIIGQATPISDVRGSEEYRKAMLLTLGMRALDRAHERLAA